MKLRTYNILWGLLIIFLLGVIVGIVLSESVSESVNRKEIIAIADSIFDARCIDVFDKDMLVIIERVCRTTVAHNPKLYRKEQAYFDTWTKMKFEEHNEKFRDSF